MNFKIIKTNAEKEIQKKCVEVLEKVAKYQKEHNTHPARAWEAVRVINNLTPEEMQQIAYIAVCAK